MDKNTTLMAGAGFAVGLVGILYSAVQSSRINDICLDVRELSDYADVYRKKFNNHLDTFNKNVDIANKNAKIVDLNIADFDERISALENAVLNKEDK